MPRTEVIAPEAPTVGQLSPTRFPEANPDTAQVEPTHFHGVEAKTGINQALDTVKTAAQQAAHQTVEIVKHIPEAAQHGAQATAGFVKQIPDKVRQLHVPEQVQHGAHATAEFVKHIPEGVQHGAQATLDFVKHIPENVQHGAQATAGFVKQRLPERAAAASTDAGKPATETPQLSGTATIAPGAGLVAPATPYDYSSPTSCDKREYLETIGRSDSEGMHMHAACGAARRTTCPENVLQDKDEEE